MTPPYPSPPTLPRTGGDNRSAHTTRFPFVTVGLVTGIVLGGITLGGWLLLRPTPAPVPTPAPTATATAEAVPLTSTATAVPADASTALAGQRSADHARAESVTGSWIPQLSAKRDGLRVSGVTYDDDRIWQEFQATRSGYPDAIMIRSEDYSSFSYGGFWIVLLARPMASADTVNTWCATQGFSRDDCFAKRLSHTEGPDGNTVLRR